MDDLRDNDLVRAGGRYHASRDDHGHTADRFTTKLAFTQMQPETTGEAELT